MTAEELKNYLQSWDDSLEFIEQVPEEVALFAALEDIPSEWLNVEVPLSHFKGIMKQLKADENTAFDYLFNMTGMDWGQELGVIYHLESTRHGHILVVRVRTADRENPEIPTVEDIWKTAHLHEREIYDLLGIRFTGHSNLKRIFLTPDFQGHPLRKDYEDDYMILRK